MPTSEAGSTHWTTQTPLTSCTVTVDGSTVPGSLAATPTTLPGRSVVVDPPSLVTVTAMVTGTPLVTDSAQLGSVARAAQISPELSVTTIAVTPAATSGSSASHDTRTSPSPALAARLVSRGGSGAVDVVVTGSLVVPAVPLASTVATTTVYVAPATSASEWKLAAVASSETDATTVLWSSRIVSSCVAPSLAEESPGVQAATMDDPSAATWRSVGGVGGARTSASGALDEVSSCGERSSWALSRCWVGRTPTSEPWAGATDDGAVLAPAPDGIARLTAPATATPTVLNNARCITTSTR